MALPLPLHHQGALAEPEFQQSGTSGQGCPPAPWQGQAPLLAPALSRPPRIAPHFQAAPPQPQYLHSAAAANHAVLHHSLQPGCAGAAVPEAALQQQCVAAVAPAALPAVAAAARWPPPGLAQQTASSVPCPGNWQAMCAAQQALLPLQPQAQLQHGYAVAAGPGLSAGAACLAAGVQHAAQAAGWAVLQPRFTSLGSFPGAVHGVASEAPQHAQACLGTAAAAAAQDAVVRHDSKRVRRRRPTARRSLINLFDAAAAQEEEEYLSDASDCDSEMALGSQDSFQSCSTLGAFLSPFSATPCTPHITTPLLSASPLSSAAGDMDSPGGTPASQAPDAAGTAAAAGEHMLPLQHLLMSERAEHLTALEVKAIVFKVAADLAALHDEGVLHRHVTVASVVLSRNGNLATARLMGHPYNVDAGQGRRYIGGKKAGVDAYLAPELARCPSDCVAYTPAADLWSLGIVTFVLLSGSHVPFGNRGLCWTTVPNMPGPLDSVDKLQRWLEEHLMCKFGVINHLKQSQEKGKAPLGAAPEVRVVGVDDAACDLIMRLLSADPAARPTARQVLGHPWLAEVASLQLLPSSAPCSAEALAPLADSPGFEAKLCRTASELASLGFIVMPADEAPLGMDRHPSNLSSCTILSAPSSCDFQTELGCLPGPRGMASAYNSNTDLAAAGGASTEPQAAQAQQAQAWGQLPPAAATAAGGHSILLSDGTTLQLLPAEWAQG